MLRLSPAPPGRIVEPVDRLLASIAGLPVRAPRSMPPSDDGGSSAWRASSPPARCSSMGHPQAAARTPAIRPRRERAALLGPPRPAVPRGARWCLSRSVCALALEAAGALTCLPPPGVRRARALDRDDAGGPLRRTRGISLLARLRRPSRAVSLDRPNRRLCCSRRSSRAPGALSATMSSRFEASRSVEAIECDRISPPTMSRLAARHPRRD